MIEHPYRIAGDATVTRFVQTRDDFDAFRAWLRNLDVGRVPVLGIDTETTGLDIYAPDYECRLVQVGTTHEAWVIPTAGRIELIAAVLGHEVGRGRRFVAHNAAFDLLVMDRVGLVDFEAFGPAMIDTRILAHLLDPRSAHEGGTGHGLKRLAEIYVDPDAPDTADGLHAIFLGLFRAWGKTVDRSEVAAYRAAHPRRPHIGFGFRHIPIDHPTYVLYAGLDVLLVTRLMAELTILIRGNGLSVLAGWEHRVMLAGARMQRRGMLIDVDYTTGLVDTLTAEHERHVARAASYGVANINAPRQVVDGLLGLGEAWRDTTASGAPAAGKEVLLPMADLDPNWERLNLREPNPIADAVVRGKRALKWRESYAAAFLAGRDAGDRIHASINTLAARTARMSVSSPPLQQLPSSDWTIRRAVIADPGMVLVSADLSSVELRVLAALADVTAMKDAIARGDDLHDATAALVYGDAYGTVARVDGRLVRTPAQNALRKRVKAVGLGKVYGGGKAGLARQTGLPLDAISDAVDGYDAAYPEVNAYGRELQRTAARSGGIVYTPRGRRLPLDRDRAYAATNYVVQSTARDLMAAAMLEMEARGLTDHLLLPIHDQMLAQFPAGSERDGAEAIGDAMRSVIAGVPIDSDPEVVGDNWGMAYKGPARP